MGFTSWNRSRGRPCFRVSLYLLFGLGLTFSAATEEVALLPPVLLYNDVPSVDTKLIEDVILRELERQLSEDQIDYIVLADGSSIGDSPLETVLVSEFGIAEDRLYLSLTLRASATGATLAGAAGRSSLDIGLFNQVARLYREIDPRFAMEESPVDGDSAEAQEAAEEVPTLVAGVRFLSPQDGVEVRRRDGQLLGVTDGGEATADYLVLGASGQLSLLLERPGFYPKEITVKIGPGDRGDSILLPPLDRATRVATFVGWSPQQVLGLSLGGRYYLQPDLSFLQLEALYHLQRDFGSDATGSSSHFDTRLAGGRYVLLDYSSWFRASLEAAIGLIYTSFPGKEVDAYLDPYLVPLALSLEANGANISIFVRFESRFALSGPKAFFPRGVVKVPGQDLPILATIGVLSKW